MFIFGEKYKPLDPWLRLNAGQIFVTVGENSAKDFKDFNFVGPCLSKRDYRMCRRITKTAI